MADEIQRTIYKIEIEDSGYVRGIETLSLSTKKFEQAQAAANKTLQTNEAALKSQSEYLARTKKDLDAYTGSNEKYRQQLQKDFTDAETENKRLTALVNDNRKAYEAATKAADDFALTAQKASDLVQPSGKVPVPSVVPERNPVASAVNNIQPGDLSDAVVNSKEEFNQFSVAIELAEEHMATLNEESEEFKNLAPIVAQGKVALEQYDKAAGSAGQKTLSLRAQLRQGREELVKLEQAGKGATQQYFELEKRVAKLTDEFGDQQARIKILASDTKLLDFGKGAITGATAAFQAYTSVAILAGSENEELQKKTMQLFAAMQLLQSMEQLSNLTRREGVLATLAQSGAQAVYTATVGASTGALRAFRLALLGTGIGAAVIAIGYLIKRYIDHKNALAEATEKQRLFNEVNKEAADSVGAEVAKLGVFQDKLNDLNIDQKQRVDIAKEYNKTADETNKIDLKQIDNLTLINQKIDAQNKLIIQRAVSTAALSKLTEQSSKLVEAQLRVDQELERTGFKELQLIERQNKAIGQQVQFRDRQTQSLDNFANKQVGNTNKVVVALTQEEQAVISLINTRNSEQRALDELARRLNPLITPQGITTEDGGKDAKEIENVFEQERLRLQSQLAELRNSEVETIKSINDEFAAKLEVERKRINDLIKEGKLFGSIADEDSQAGIIFKLSAEVNQTELNKALSDFNKKITDARNKLNAELLELQNKNNADSLNLLRDEFERRRLIIEENEKQDLQDAADNAKDRLDSLALDRLLIGEDEYQKAKAVLIEQGEIQANNIVQRYADQRAALAADVYRRSLDAFQIGLNQGLIGRDEEIAKQIRTASNLFLQGKISYQQFQKDLTKIQRDEEGIRRDLQLDSFRRQQADLDEQIKNTVDKTSKEYEDLLKLREDYRAKIAKAEQEDAEADATDQSKDNPDSPVAKLTDYVDAVGKLADSVISFWEKANEAEQKSLDRSIAIQEKRVEAAQRIADRGNAQYLREEEDKLNELNVKRENAARRQMTIDAALQASQILVGITGAISHIGTGTAAQTIAEIAVIVGALASGYALIKNLQGNQPQLAEGTTYVKREGHPAGVDTIPAWLNEGEAVINAETNKKYHPAIKAIHENKIPAEDLNNFVTNYNNHVVKQAHPINYTPLPNYERIKEVAEIKTSSDGRMAVLLEQQNSLLIENNDLQRQILKKKGVKVEQTFDRNGIAAAVTEYMNQEEINKHV